jgi:hypothetical protein
MTYVEVEFLEDGRPVYATAEAVKVLRGGTLMVGLEVTLAGYQGDFVYRVMSHQKMPSCSTIWICVLSEGMRTNFRHNFKPGYGWTLSEISLCAVETPR